MSILPLALKQGDSIDNEDLTLTFDSVNPEES